MPSKEEEQLKKEYLKDDLAQLVITQRAAIEEKDKEILKLNKTLQDLGEDASVSMDKTLERVKRESEAKYKALEEKANILEHILTLREKSLDEYVSAHGDLLKVIQGATDMSIRNNTFLLNKIKSDNELIKKSNKLGE